ncbi:MAG: dihydropteroate synthase [Proteobacteria bacterium]|nr:dihydropteroate synthase [Pseudomonadota bacterium]
MNWHIARQVISLDVPKIMGIWNVSPDSFSSFVECDAGLALASRLIREGADILDVGAESTRPGADPVSPAEEAARLASLSQARMMFTCPISLDSRHVETIEWALKCDLVDIVNDIGESEQISERREGKIYRLVGERHAGIVLMAWRDHNAGSFGFEACMRFIYDQLARRIEYALYCGVAQEAIVVDPGIGFGKGLENDLRLITEAPRALAPLGCPVLIAHSRKRCLARATGLTVPELDWPTAVTAALAMQNGAAIVRVHAPKETVVAKKLVAHSGRS